MTMENIREVVSENLAKLRKEKKWTQLELAEKLNYSNKAISRWEKGEVLPDIETLNQLSELYGIELSELFETYEPKEHIFNKKFKRIGNKVTITLLSVLAVWLIAVLVYVQGQIIFGLNLWQIYAWSVPASMIIAIIFNSIWGKKIWTLVFVSILIWSLLACLYAQLYKYNIWMIFFIGIPLQIGVVLWGNLKSHKKNKKE